MMKVFNIEVPSHNKLILQSLHKLQQNGLYCDVTVEAKNGFIYVHQVVLSANGNNFQGHIYTSTKVDSKNVLKILDCKKYDIQLVEVFVVYLYTGKVSIEEKCVFDLIKLFDEFDLTAASLSVKRFIDSADSYQITGQTKISHQTLHPQIQKQPLSLETENKLNHSYDAQKSNSDSCENRSSSKEITLKSKNEGEISHIAEDIRNLQTVNDGNNLYLRICDNLSQIADSDRENKQIDSCCEFDTEMDELDNISTSEKEISLKKGLSCEDANDISNKILKVRIKRQKSDSIKFNMKTDHKSTENEKNERTHRTCRKRKLDTTDEFVCFTNHNITNEKIFKKVKTCFNEKGDHIVTAKDNDKISHVSRRKFRTKINKINVRNSSNINAKKKRKDEKNFQNMKCKIRKQKSKLENNGSKPEHSINKIEDSTENIESEKFSGKKKNKSQNPVWRKCGRCSLSFKSYSEHATHMRDIHKPYPCQLCNWVGHKRHLHASHMYGQHKIVAYPDTYPLVQCDEEGCSFKCLGINLHEHKRCHLHKTDQLVCDVCGMKFTSAGGLRNHSFIHQDEELKYKCKECGKIFGWKNLLTNHLFTEHASVKLCHLCPFKTKSKTTLNIHLHNKHGEPIPQNQVVHRCDQCEFYCFSSTYLKIHKEQSHSDTAKYKCTFCPKSFKSQKSLRMHRVATHDSKNVKCPHCDYVTYSKSALSHHLNSSHSDARPFACHLCDYSCKLKCNLGKHIKNVHKLDTSKVVSSSVKTVDQEVNSAPTEFPEKRNDECNLLFSVHHDVDQRDMFSLPKTSEQGHFMSLPRTSVESSVISTKIVSKSTENMIDSQNVDSVENILVRHMVQEGDKTFMSI